MSFLAQVTYTGNGSTTQYSIPFEFIDSTHVKAFIDGVETSAFTISSSTLTFTTAPANASTIRIERQTPNNQRLIDFTDGSVLTEQDLDKSADQNFYIAQEITDDSASKLGLDTDDKYNANNKIIKNVADPVNNNDAVNKQFISTNLPNITTVAGISSDVTTVAGISSNVTSVANNETNVNTVATNIASVNTVATNINDVIAVANDLAEAVSEVETVANDLNEATSEIEVVANNITNVNTVGTNIANVNTVGGISANVTTVAGISSDVTTVANDATDIGTVATNIANVNTVAGNNANITTVAGNNANVSTVAGISGNVTTVAGISADITAVAGDATDIGTVATNIANVNSVATNISNVNSVASNSTNINAVNANSANINTVSGISADVTTVATNNANVTAVAGNASNINSVAGNSTNINAVASNATNINAVNTNSANINTVAGAISNVNAVGTDITNVNTVANNLASVNSFANTYLGASATPPTQDPDGSSLDLGDLYFDSASDTMKVYSSGGWINAGSAVNGTANRFKYTATASQTTFSGADDSGNTLAYDSGYADIYLNGVKLVNGSDFTATTGNSIVLNSGASLNDILEVIAYGTFTLSNFSITDANDVPALGSAGQALVVNSAGTSLEFANASSAEVYGFNKDSNGNLIVTTTNQGQDNISSTDYANFDDVLFSASGFTFSISNGELIATI